VKQSSAPAACHVVRPPHNCAGEVAAPARRSAGLGSCERGPAGKLDAGKTYLTNL